MKILTLCGLLVLSLAAPVPAVLCAVDEVPAATLLIPHFMVDLDACGSPGLNTVVKITNTEPTSTVVHLTFWTDWGAPVIDYDLYLTGFDVESLDLADHFCNGNVTVTGESVSPHGSLSGDPDQPPQCDLVLPLVNPALTASLLDRLRYGHTGQPAVASGGCLGADHGDNVARGYLTIDVVNDCTFLFPSQPDYLSTFLSHENRLLGEYFYVDPASGFYQSYPAVHLEADTAGLTFGPGDHTFYGRYASALAIDRREPLPTTFGASFSRNEPLGTELFVWRESPGVTDGEGATCGSSPAEFPLTAPEVLAFDEEENPILVPVEAPLQTQRVTLVEVLPPSPEAGWMRMNLRHLALAGVYNDGLAQAWVTTLSPRLVSVARGSGDPPEPLPPFAGFPAIALDNICAVAAEDQP